jgi:predicted methyltransferase
MSNVTISWVRYTEDGEEETVLFPAKNEVCYTCNGTGKTVNPSIDGNGITASEMDELGEDFREDYMSGVYDVQCRTCKGKNVIAQIDRPACNRNPKLRALLKLKDKQEADDARDEASERWLRMAESGERW